MICYNGGENEYYTRTCPHPKKSKENDKMNDMVFGGACNASGDDEDDLCLMVSHGNHASNDGFLIPDVFIICVRGRSGALLTKS